MEKQGNEVAEAVIDLGKVIMRFAQINRITFFEDGVTPESDTDHTVMLAVVACAFAERFVKKLDVGKVAQFAIIHDLVEVYAGDTPNISGQTLFDKNSKDEKDAREHQALLRLEKEFKNIFPWLTNTIDAYESLNSPEARYVKVMDKIMPKITHFTNNAITHKKHGMTKEQSLEAFQKQISNLRGGYGSDQEEALELFEEIAKKFEEIL